MMLDLKLYPLYKDSGVPWLGAVPATWKITRNSGLFTQRNETGFGGLPILEVSLKTGVRVRGFDGNGRKQVMADRGKYKRARRGDLAYNMMRMWQGAVGLAPVDGLVSPAYVVARPFPTVEPRFFEYLFRTDTYMGEVDKFSHGIVKDRNRLYWEDFKQMPSPVPPPNEQAAIVRFLDHADRRIRLYIRAKQKLIALLAETREAVTHDALQLASTRSLPLEVVADRVDRPINRRDDQVYTPIGLFNRGRGIFHKEPTKGAELGDSTFFWIKEGDLVLSGQFAWEGAIALAGPEDSGCVATHRYPVFRGKRDLVESAYLLSFFKTSIGHLLLDQHSRGAAGRNRPLNAHTLMKEKIPIPPLPAQQRITALVHLENRLYRTVAKLAEFLREYRTRLIADVVTGKLDVREAAARLSDEEKSEELEGAEGLAEEEEGESPAEEAPADE